MGGNAQTQYAPSDGGEEGIPVEMPTKKAVSSWVHLLAGAYVFSSWYYVDSSNIIIGAVEWLPR